MFYNNLLELLDQGYITLGDNRIDVFKIGDSLDFTMFSSCIYNFIGADMAE